MLLPHSRGGVDVGGSEAAAAAASTSKEAAETAELRNVRVRVLQIRTGTRTNRCAMQCRQLLVSLM